jgi:hypothetical protein
MFTSIRLALTALIITASLLTPISANAKKLSAERGKEVLYYGEIISVDTEGTGFVIRYQKDIFYCAILALTSEIYIFCRDAQTD